MDIVFNIIDFIFHSIWVVFKSFIVLGVFLSPLLSNLLISALAGMKGQKVPILIWPSLFLGGVLGYIVHWVLF